MVLEKVDLAEVVEEEAPGVLGRNPGAVEIGVFGRVLAKVGAQTDQVALVADDVDQLVLAEEAPDGVVALADLLARLDRDRDEIAVGEPEAQHDVSDRVAHPVDGDQVDLVELAQIEGLVVVVRRVVESRSSTRSSGCCGA